VGDLLSRAKYLQTLAFFNDLSIMMPSVALLLSKAL
jgi:hypothetical protein